MKIRVRTLRIGAREFKWTAEACGHYDIESRTISAACGSAWGGGKNARKLRVDLESTNPGGWAAFLTPPIPLPAPCAPSLATPLNTAGTLRPSAGVLN
jgi:hypothetical protein